jgi:hypothetical protein
MALIAIRVVVFVLALTAVMIAVVPIVVMIDLVSGGTGYGLCPGGLDACDRPYTTGAEIVIILSLALFAVVLAIRALMRLARKLQSETYQASQ